MTDRDVFTTETDGLPESSRTRLLRLRDGDRLDLRVSPVRTDLNGAHLRMLAYNGSIPGPTLHVDQGSKVIVRTRNDGDVETTVHWHGLRLENRYDGVPHETQMPIPIGGSYTCTVQFPDAGFYWYHPHLREDFAQEMGLYGSIIVEPQDPEYWPAADRALALTLDDLLVEDGHIAPFRQSGPNYTAMGRFGNEVLINGSSTFADEARAGEVVRLYLVNTANTRIFNFAVRGARAKLIGGDSGRYEHETLVEEVLLAPSERAVVDVLFDAPGKVRLEHRTPDRVYDLGAFDVTAREGSVTAAAATFEQLRTDPTLSTERALMAQALDRTPDKVLGFFSRMPLLSGNEASDHDHNHNHNHAHEQGDGLEWEDLMPEMNRASDPSNMIWQLIDRETGAVNGGIDWAFTVGERIKIRLVNETDSDHPMHHPFHIHGAGRFLILSRGGEPEPNLVWKDTVLVRAGQTVDILLEVSNPGRWMAHCHIAEHAESGMMFSFNVARKPEPAH
ncbi:MAG TPA: multicopper oxidase family protein [Cryobacterium sp.]|nr:multicopper oxidase family protein [Cryobacterium sp.]